MSQGTQNFSAYESIKKDADFLMNMVESKREGAASKDMPLPKASLETKALRSKLRNDIPFKQFPGWLEDIELEGVKQDGTVVVTFEDELIVDYCKVRFSQEILLSATSLWKNINKVAIRQRLSNGASSAVEKLLKNSENTQEKSTIAQALQSLKSIGSTIKSVGTLGTREACPAFG